MSCHMFACTVQGEAAGRSAAIRHERPTLTGYAVLGVLQASLARAPVAAWNVDALAPVADGITFLAFVNVNTATAVT